MNRKGSQESEDNCRTTETDEAKTIKVSPPYINNLKNQIRHLQRKSDTEKPLLDIGVAIRLRFLE
jgi:hypothetical protein